ncbi:MAG: DUF4388 domain-containing protein [Acidobacteria bacterium]|nr:DUF4388 domain-containing protein [Acidobacteriota bacterium]
MRFMVLTGHLDDYSLPGLIKMLHDQRKTGRLQVDYAESPAAFYFEDGRLIDAKIGDLRGLEAVYLALSLAGASFNFNPLIKPPERTVEEREQRLIQGLLEVPSGGGASDIPDTIERRERALTPPLPAAAATSLLPAADSQPALRAQVEERLIAEVGAALASHSKRFSRERAFYVTVIAVLLLLAFIPRVRNDAPVTIVPSSDTKSEALTSRTTTEAAPSTDTSNVHESIPSQPVADKSRVREQPLGSPDHAPAKLIERSNKLSKASKAPNLNRKNESKTGSDKSADNKDRRTVKVLLRVERGRVLHAVVQNPHAGMESFEALALRIARQRQYPKDFSGRDVLQIDVKPQ